MPNPSTEQPQRSSYDRVNPQEEVRGMSESEKRLYARRTMHQRQLQTLLMERMGVVDDATMMNWTLTHASRFRAILMGDVVLLQACDSEDERAVADAFPRLLAQWERFAQDVKLAALLEERKSDAAMEYVRQQLEQPLH